MVLDFSIESPESNDKAEIDQLYNKGIDFDINIPHPNKFVFSNDNIEENQLPSQTAKFMPIVDPEEEKQDVQEEKKISTPLTLKTRNTVPIKEIKKEMPECTEQVKKAGRFEIKISSNCPDANQPYKKESTFKQNSDNLIDTSKYCLVLTLLLLSS
jgi:hypothetical protein